MGKTKPVSKQTFLKCRKNNNTFIRTDWLDIFPEPIKFHVTTHIRISHYCNKGLKIVCTFITRIDMDSESRSLIVWPPAKEKISKVWPLSKQSSLGQEPRMTGNWGGLYSYIRILPHIISFEIDCFYGMWARIYEYGPPQLPIFGGLCRYASDKTAMMRLLGYDETATHGAQHVWSFEQCIFQTIYMQTKIMKTLDLDFPTHWNWSKFVPPCLERNIWNE